MEQFKNIIKIKIAMENPILKLVMKKGIKLNVETQTIEVVPLGDDYTEIYDVIGNDCSTFEVPITFDNNDAMYCDEEALFKPFEGGIIMEGWSQPIIGNVLILGTDADGNSCDAQTCIEDLKKQIKFLTHQEIVTYQW